ncbi:MAG TPA: envelope integrity protein Cei [Pseudonocardiaceae bacterium]|nr:envelope integrity protein Cei [Pseudonocardiaceae bacterium]
MKIGEGRVSLGQAETYHRRRPLVGIVVLCVLMVAAAIVWSRVIRQADDVNAQVACPASQVATEQLDTPVSYTALDAVAPAPASSAQVQVFNASNERGQAARITTELQQFGFTQTGVPADDPEYPQGNLRCVGQIRFGPNGVSAARTLSLLVPCAQLVRDNRQNSTVDLAVGTAFVDLTPSADATDVLQQLATWSQQHPVTGGGLQSYASIAPHLQSSLLTGAHNGQC